MSTDNAIILSHLRARDDRGSVFSLDLELPRACSGALVGAPADGTSVLASVLSGASRPKSGKVRVDGFDPWKVAGLRARIGALLCDPIMPAHGTVAGLIDCTQTLRGGMAPKDQWFDWLHLQGLESCKLSKLDRSQQRLLCLGLALAVPNPVALVLHEPLSGIGVVSAARLAEVLAERTKQGACVLVLTASVSDAASLVADVATISRGQISRAIGSPVVGTLTPGVAVTIQVWSSDSRMLAARLSQRPEVHSVWLETTSETGMVQVGGADQAAVARAVREIIIDAEIQLFTMRTVLPSLPEINASTAGMQAAARQWQAYRQAQFSGRHQ